MIKPKIGRLEYRPNKQNARRVVAKYKTPAQLFAKFDKLPKHITKSFPIEQETDAVAWLNRQNALIESGMWTPPKKAEKQEENSRTTLNEYFELEYIKHIQTLKPVTRKGEKNIYNSLIKPRLGSMPVQKITAQSIAEWLNSLQTTELQKYTAFRKLKTMLNHAVKTGIIIENPCNKHVYKKPRPAKQPPEPLTISEIQALAENMPDSLRLSVYLMCFCGALRIGECLALQRQDIDLKRQTLTVNHTLENVDGGILTSPKTEKSRRTIPIPKKLMPMIKTHLERFTGKSKTDYIFSYSGEHVKYSNYRLVFIQAKTDAGRNDITPHTLRHTALTMLAQNGATVKELMHTAGHSKPETAIRYQHATRERLRGLSDSVTAGLKI